MTRWPIILLAAFIGLQGTPMASHEIGDKFGPLWVGTGGMICDTVEQAAQAIDTLDTRQGKFSSGCGLFNGNARVLTEVVRLHKTNFATYIIFRIMFLPPATLGVQYGWRLHSETPTGDSI